MKLLIWTVDAFTSSPFTGNPAAVVLLDQDIPDIAKQSLAAEVNLSETAFISLLSETDTFSGSRQFGLRWFTPTTEVPLCGHATLASATVLFRECGNINESIMFSTKSGMLEARRGEDDKVILDLPLNPPGPVDEGQFLDLIKEVTCDLPVREVVLSNNARKLVIRLDSFVTRKQLEDLRPSIEKLTSLETSGVVKGVILTVMGDGEYHFFSRYFAPWVGIDEDPVTGSAHTVLGPYWSSMNGQTRMKARQCSPRGGDLDLEIRENRLHLAGEAVIVITGTVNLDIV